MTSTASHHDCETNLGSPAYGDRVVAIREERGQEDGGGNLCEHLVGLCHCQEQPDKYRTVLGTPIRDEMARFCNSSMGMEVFSINMAYEMTLSRCYQVGSSVSLNIFDSY